MFNRRIKDWYCKLNNKTAKMYIDFDFIDDLQDYMNMTD
jgi:hypothetical protein